jgi:PPK2 family polyphosphate:nucleotide phosphotransferase
MKHTEFIVSPKKRLRLKERDTAATGKFTSEEAARKKIERDCEELARLQDMLLARESHGLLLIFQAMDGAGKDGTIKYVMSNADPQGCKAYNFKEPSDEEAKHDYLWRFHREMPERGQIGVFNRSYYEEVLITRIHKEKLDAQGLPAKLKGKDLWKRRYEEINSFEQYLVNNGILVLKFFLHLSKEKQRERLLERMELPEKKWKFSMTDIEDRKLWVDYMRMYEDVLNHTSTPYAPWYIVPADHRWFTSLAVADIVVTKLKELKLRYPQTSDEAEKDLTEAKRALESE